MRTLKGLTLVAAAVVLALAAQGTAAGPTTVTNVYTVGPLTVPGVDTGLVLENGLSVTVTATGSVCHGNSFCMGPNGDPSFDTTQSAYGGFVQPSAPAWGLVGRVGSGPWVQVGSGPTTLSGDGVLVFAVNDDLLADNSGSFTATVSYTSSGPSRTCYPGWGYGDENHEHCGPPGLANKPSSPGESSSNEHANSQTGGDSKSQGATHRP